MSWEVESELTRARNGGWPDWGATGFGPPNRCRAAPEHGLRSTRGTLKPSPSHRVW
jgi:hypothetical protein